MQITAIGDEQTITALRLAGISGKAAFSPEEANDLLNQFAHQNDLVVLIAQSVAAMVQERVDEMKIARSGAIVLEIPDMSGVPVAETAEKLVAQAVGLKL